LIASDRKFIQPVQLVKLTWCYSLVCSNDPVSRCPIQYCPQFPNNENDVFMLLESVQRGKKIKYENWYK